MGSFERLATQLIECSCGVGRCHADRPQIGADSRDLVHAHTQLFDRDFPATWLPRVSLGHRRAPINEVGEVAVRTPGAQSPQYKIGRNARPSMDIFE